MMIPYGHQDVSEEDVAAVVDVLRSDWLTQGPAIERFERSVSAACGAQYAVAVSNGTAALHLACLAAGLREGGLLWTSPITFVASANCGRYCGAEIDFVDIDSETVCMSTDALATKLERAARVGRLPDIVVPVHFAGASCDMAAIGALAARYDFTVIEDACHALGGAYRGEPVGSCAHAHMAAFSFHPVKTVTSGEGGMIVANEPVFAERLRLLRTHGITRDPALLEGGVEGPWYYEQVGLGFNYRVTDIQAALGESQMKRLSEFVLRRIELARRYDEAFRGMPLGRPRVPSDVVSARHLYVIRVEAARRLQVFEALRAAGIGVGVHYIPVHMQPYYRRRGFAPGDFPEAERYYSEAVTIPLFPAMTDDEQATVIEAVGRALRE